MRISSLQLGLIVAGILLVLGVIVYNRWQERRIRRRIDTAFDRAPAGKRVEPTLATDADAAAGRAVPASAADPDDDRGDPADDPRSDPTETHVAADPHWEPPLDAVRKLPPEGAVRAPLPRETIAQSSAGPQPDPDIECVMLLQPVKPVSAGAVAAGLHARIGKPLRWFGRRDDASAWQRLASDTRGEFGELAACLLLADRNGAAGAKELAAFMRIVSDLAPTLPAAFIAPELNDEVARAETLDRLCAELDMQIGITVRKGDGATIAGTKLRGVVEAAGFRLAPGGSFEWVQDDTGTVVYSLASLDGEPFSIDGLRSTGLPGVVLVLDVPRVADPARAFDQMKLAARRLALTLGADIVDDNGRPLEDEALAKIRAQVAAAAAALRDVHIEPGSPRALKLFAA